MSLRIVALVSGGGTTLQNLLDVIAAGKLAAEVVGVVSSHPRAYALERARSRQVPTAVVEARGRAPHELGAQVFDQCHQWRAQLVVCAGFLHLLSLPDAYRHRVMNIHPSLIPAFCGKGYYGRRVHEAVLERGVRYSGCTVHFLDEHYDHGPIILQRVVPVLQDDTPERLAERVFDAECLAYPEAIELFAAGRLKVEGRRVLILPERSADA